LDEKTQKNADDNVICVFYSQMDIFPPSILNKTIKRVQNTPQAEYVGDKENFSKFGCCSYWPFHKMIRPTIIK